MAALRAGVRRQCRAISTQHSDAAPRILEIGFGNGGEALLVVGNAIRRATTSASKAAPGVGRLLNALDADDATTCASTTMMPVEVLEHEIADGSLDEGAHLLPRPWHKKRHHKRRLVNLDFAALLVLRLAPGGRLHPGHRLAGLRRTDVGRARRHPGLPTRRPRGSVPRGLATADPFRDPRQKLGACGFVV